MNSRPPLSPSWQRITVTCLLGVLCFGAGWFARNRNLVSQAPDVITVVGANGAVQNSLSNMQILDIVGVGELDNENTQYRQFGQLYYFVQEDLSTEIHIRLSGIPETITNRQENGPTKAIPRTLEVQLAILTIGGDDYTYQTVGQIKLSPDENNILRGEYSTVLEPVADYRGELVPALQDVQRIVFNSLAEDNIFRDANDDLPIRVRERPAPFFWTVVE